MTVRKSMAGLTAMVFFALLVVWVVIVALLAFGAGATVLGLILFKSQITTWLRGVTVLGLLTSWGYWYAVLMSLIGTTLGVHMFFDNVGLRDKGTYIFMFGMLIAGGGILAILLIGRFVTHAI